MTTRQGASAPNPPHDTLGEPFGEGYSHQYERDMLTHREGAWLRAKGWKHTCETPGSFWLWKKTLQGEHARGENPPGTVILTNQDMALTLQRAMDDWDDMLAAQGGEGEG